MRYVAMSNATDNRRMFLAWVWAEGWTDLTRGDRMGELLEGIRGLNDYSDKEIREAWDDYLVGWEPAEVLELWLEFHDGPVVGLELPVIG